MFDAFVCKIHLQKSLFCKIEKLRKSAVGRFSFAFPIGKWLDLYHPASGGFSFVFAYREMSQFQKNIPALHPSKRLGFTMSPGNDNFVVGYFRKNELANVKQISRLADILLPRCFS